MNYRDSLRKLQNPDFRRATLYWSLSRSLGLQVHDVLAVRLSALPSSWSKPPSGCRFHALRSVRDLDALGASIESQLDEESGTGCRKLLERGDAVYAILEGDRVACQLNIRKSPVHVDSPTELVFVLGAGDVFLNYLQTRNEYRGRGLASRLIVLACADASTFARRCLSHVRATNYASLSAFRRGGWTTVGRIVSTRSGRFIAAPGCARSGMTVRMASPVVSNA